MVLFDFVCAMLWLPSIIERNSTNITENFFVDFKDTAWYAGSIYLSQMFGSFLVGCGYKFFVRKPLLLLINVPMIIAWVLVGFRWSTHILASVTIIVCVTIGYLEGSVSDYISQISQPHLRKTLGSFSDVFRTFCGFLVSGLGLLTTRKIAAIVGIFLHVFVATAIAVIPKTTKLQITDGNMGKTEKTLHWPIGWAQARQVAEGLQEVAVIAEKNCTDGGAGALSENTPYQGVIFLQQFRVLNTLRVFKSLGSALMLLLISNFNGTIASQPYIYMLSKDFGMPMRDSVSAFVFNLVGFVASVLCMVTTGWFGRKAVVLCSATVTTISTGVLFSCESWVAFFSYMALVFATVYGLDGNIWSVLDDLFPQEGRVLAFRIATAIDCFYNAIAVSSYTDLKRLVGIKYVYLYYTVFNVCGLIVSYFFIPKMKNILLKKAVNNKVRNEENIETQTSILDP